MEVKQVIVMRMKYPNSTGGTKQISHGKMIAQGAHASLSFLAEKLDLRNCEGKKTNVVFDKEEKAWFEGCFTKVCLKVDSEEELIQVYNKAKKLGLRAHLIKDAGRTEFHGNPTYTCCAIGPNYASQIDSVTGDLKLL